MDFARAPGRPLCKYRNACYRKNPQHWLEFDHEDTHPVWPRAAHTPRLSSATHTRACLAQFLIGSRAADDPAEPSTKRARVASDAPADAAAAAAPAPAATSGTVDGGDTEEDEPLPAVEEKAAENMLTDADTEEDEPFAPAAPAAPATSDAAPAAAPAPATSLRLAHKTIVFTGTLG